MKFLRRHSDPSKKIYDQVKWRRLDVKITEPDGKVIFARNGIEVPADWSQNAANILAQKYFRRAGVPTDTVSKADHHAGMPLWLVPRKPAPDTLFDGEISAHQVFYRMAGCWTYWGWQGGYFTDETDAEAFFDETYLALAQQRGAPNSPQWFNTGLFWAYGITFETEGQWAFDSDRTLPDPVFQAPDAYERPQPHACFIQPVADSLVEPGGMLDLWAREARLFKFGSGSGSNMSAIRAKGERLSSGGVSSGLISFLEVGDRNAGSIQSGGTTRRAALMRCLDLDHPEVEDFIWWKVREERKAQAMELGSSLLKESDDGEVYSAGWEGEAIRTVSGQNSNNSVRVTNDFLQRVDEDKPWSLINRVDGTVNRAVPARDLWWQICQAAWKSADPGVQFHDTINVWHTCSDDGPINASNPCSEYMFLDNTACNLASIRLTAYLRDNGSFDTEDYEHDIWLWTVVLDISVTMASYPSRHIAANTWKYRTLGLGYADLGGLLMRMALPYDSVSGRALAGALTALLTGVAYKCSQQMAHEKTLGAFPRWEANSEPMRAVLLKHRAAVREISCGGAAGAVVVKALQVWDGIDYDRGFRNAQVTLIAPTGTISFVMDCDTTGIEPDLALAKHKNLAGGGTMTIVNQAVPTALRRLGFSNLEIDAAVELIRQTGSLESAMRLREHLAVFDCAMPARPAGRVLTSMAHVMMVAAVQPFLSGSVSKTINLPAEATVYDINQVYREAHQLGLKSVAVYRDGCKLSQPLNVKKDQQDKTVVPLHPVPTPEVRGFGPLARGQREYLPWRRAGITQKCKIGDQTVFLTVNTFPDGRPGEMFLELAHEGSTLRSMANLLAMAVSVGLQHGVPVAEFVDRFIHTRFEPAGVVEGHDRIKMVSSIGDYIGRELGVNFLGQDELADTQPLVSVGKDKIVAMLDNWALAVVGGYSGDICPSCHNATCRRTGSCLTCESCGWDGGCG
jgi:ribonucleoside-diphosphate reductase alpha chain